MAAAGRLGGETEAVAGERAWHTEWHYGLARSRAHNIGLDPTGKSEQWMRGG